MNKILLVLYLLMTLNLAAQSKIDYLHNNRFDLRAEGFNFPQNDFNIIGFGAYHGSAKTEETENLLLKSLTKEGAIKYYLPETDFSIAYYLNDYLQSGDTIFLKDLVAHYGIRVPQDRSIETYEKWKAIKNLNDSLPSSNKLEVVGIDLIVSYKYTAKHLLELFDFGNHQSKALKKMEEMLVLDTTDYTVFYDSYSKTIFKNFIQEFENDSIAFFNSKVDTFFKFCKKAPNHISNQRLSIVLSLLVF